MEKKNMKINCGTCDVRKVQEETLAQYDSIAINAGLVLSDERSRALLDKYNVHLNCGTVLDVEGDVQIKTINGSHEIRSTDAVEGKFYYVVNGRLVIGTGTEKIMENCVGLMINGVVSYPESMSGKLAMMPVNGAASCYPDGAVVLKRTAVIDRTFVLRAKECLYWAERRMIFVDPKLDAQKLADKGARFSTKEAILTEGNAEILAPLIDEKAELVIVPDGTGVIRDDVELDEALVRAKGGKLYIIGDLTVPEAAQGALDGLEYLRVQGDVEVPAVLREKVYALAEEISGTVRTLKGRQIRDRVKVRVSRWMLEQEADGLSISDCAVVQLDEDIPNELILRKLTISDCVTVCCREDQEAALALVCEGVADIGQEDGGGKMISDAVSGGQTDTKIVNTGDYVL